MRLPGVLLFVLLFSRLNSQDTANARKIIRFLTSEKCFGRGYVKNGLASAESYIVAEITKQKAQPLFGTSYLQPFRHKVNTFPRRLNVSVNGKKLRTGLDFIPDSGCPSVYGNFHLEKQDSVSYVASQKTVTLQVITPNKLTHGVSTTTDQACVIHLRKGAFNKEPRSLKVNIKSKLIDFESRNIACFISGRKNDSTVVFTAHYDHLGGLGNKVYFPGANDNASGVAMLLDLLNHYSKNQPEYRTVFIFFAGEEAGLLGSRFFVQSDALKLKSIRFLINLDLLGTGDDGIMVVNGAVHPSEFATLSNINKERQLVKEVRKRGKAANSDHYWFSEAGVPSFFIYTLGGVSAYHDVNDIERTLPLTDYVDVFRLISAFVESL
jgi:aminopeptidase YwaD